MKRSILNNNFFGTILTNIFDYGFWLVIILCLSILAFPRFVFDFYHILHILIIGWLLLSLYFLKRLTKFQVTLCDNHTIMVLIKERFPKTYVQKLGKNIFVVEDYDGDGVFFKRRRITILIEKDRFYINILTLGGFDIPSAFHTFSNLKRSKKLAKELIELSNR